MTGKVLHWLYSAAFTACGRLDAVPRYVARLALTPTAHAMVAAAALAGRGRAAATPTPSTLERRRSDPTTCRLKLELAQMPPLAGPTRRVPRTTHGQRLSAWG